MKATVQVSRGIESLFGTRDENIRVLETGLSIRTRLGEDTLEIEGEPESYRAPKAFCEDYFALVKEGVVFKNGDLNSLLRVVTADSDVTLRASSKAASSAASARKFSRRKPSRSAVISKPSSATISSSASAPRAPARRISPSPWPCRRSSANA